MGILLPALMGASWPFAFHLLGPLKDESGDLSFSVIQDVMKGRDDFLTHPSAMTPLRSGEIWERLSRLIRELITLAGQ